MASYDARSMPSQGTRRRAGCENFELRRALRHHGEMSRIRLGDMLVQAHIIETHHVEEALAVQKKEGGRLGTILVELGYVSEMQLAQVLSNQLSIPWVNLYHVDFSRELLDLIPAEVAERFACIPVYVRKVHSQGETLFVATDDPLNESALGTLAQLAGKPVKPMVASASDVRNAIRVYYFGGKPTAATAPIKARKAKSIAPPAMVARAISMPPLELDPSDIEEEVGAPVAIPKVATVPAEAVSVPSSAQPPPVSAPSSAQPPPGAPAERPAALLGKRKPKARKFITLTLLDGTSVKLPAPGSKPAEEEEPDGGLTTRDLVAALIAKSEGKDVSSVLADARWEPLLAALLTLLLRKGLIADWEFVEEWRKRRR